MRIAFWGKGDRSSACLDALLRESMNIVAVVGQPQKGGAPTDLISRARDANLRVFEFADPNAPDSERQLRQLEADVFVLAGYGLILKRHIIDIPRQMCINLHGGKLPHYRGSSPMNWALIRGEPSFGISIIRLDSGVDTGDVLLDREFPIGPDDTIRDLHRVANDHFPPMLVEVLRQLAEGRVTPRRQDEAEAAYYPMRFPDDGLVLWDMLTAVQVHNLIRALTDPYPGAFSYYRGRRLRLLSSSLRRSPFYGEPGRVYLVQPGRFLIGCQDQCLWIEQARFEDSGEPVANSLGRYERLATAGQLIGQLAGMQA